MLRGEPADERLLEVTLALGQHLGKRVHDDRLIRCEPVCALRELERLRLVLS